MDVPPTGPARPRRAIRSFVRGTLFFSLLLGISASLAYVIDYWLIRSDNAPSDIIMNEPGIQLPEAQPASSAQLEDDVEVIGVLVDGRPRAYELRAFCPLPPEGLPAQHVVNDLLAGAPITITYCDRLDCVQVYTDTHAKTPLPVAVGGWTERGGHKSMLLCIGDSHYRQDSREALEADAPPFPYTQFNYVRMTWKQWRTAHPDTDVYLWTHPFRKDQPEAVLTSPPRQQRH